MKKIIIAPEFKEKIAKEFSTSKETVRMSLKYVFNSEQAKAIRKRAVELLRNEADSAEKFEYELDK